MKQGNAALSRVVAMHDLLVHMGKIAGKADLSWAGDLHDHVWTIRMLTTGRRPQTGKTVLCRE